MNGSRLIVVLRWLLVNLCRMALAMSLIFSGAVKLIDPRGTEYKIKDYAVAFGFDEVMGFYLPLAMSMALAMAEFCLGVNLLFGSNRRWTSRGVLMMLCLFTPLTLYLALANPVADCGCFGDAWVLTNWQSFGKNVVLLVCAAVVCRWYRHETRLISEHNQWLVTLYTWLYALVLSLYCVYTLPVIDFRPYHIGADLEEKMQWKDGDDTPPPLFNLVITDPHTGEELTDSVILGRGWRFIVVIPRVEHADDGVMDRLAELTDYCGQYDYMLVALTASSDSLVEYWRDITGAEYPILWADEIPLKTMVRSNPGLMLLKDSRVTGKWASSQIPQPQDLTGPLEQMPWADRGESTYLERLVILLMWYLIPLGVITILDRMWAGVRFYRGRRKEKESVGDLDAGGEETGDGEKCMENSATCDDISDNI